MDGAFPANLPGKTGTSFLAGIVQGIVSFFFFRDIRFESGEILDGHILASWGDQTISARQIHADAGIDKPLVLSFALEVKNAARTEPLRGEPQPRSSSSITPH